MVSNILTSQPNVFSSLSRYCGDQKEHYAVEAFVLVMNHLLRTDHEVAVQLLNRLVSTDDFAFATGEQIVVHAQQSVGEAGTPDITIRCANKRALVEAKVDAEVNPEQLHKYIQALASSGAKVPKLVLLTKRYPQLDDEELETQVKEVRWHEVGEWLSEAKEKTKGDVSRYLLSSFTTFLKEGGVSMEKVTSDYSMLKYALPQLRNLVEIMDGAAKEVTGATSVNLGRQPWGWAGFYRFYKDQKAWWFGVGFTHPLDLIFQIIDGRAYDLSALEAAITSKTCYPYRKSEDGHMLFFNWDLDARAFFSLRLEQQLAMVQELIEACSKAATSSAKPSIQRHGDGG